MEAFIKIGVLVTLAPLGLCVFIFGARTAAEMIQSWWMDRG